MQADAAHPRAGYNYNGQCTVPAGLSNIMQIAAGGVHTCALKTDHTVLCWGAWLLLHVKHCWCLVLHTHMSGAVQGAGDAGQGLLGAVAEC